LKFLCDNCKAKYQIADDKVAGKTVRMKCRKCGHQIEVRAAVTETSVASSPPQAPRPAAPRGLATSLSAQKPRQPSQPHTGALAGAFNRHASEAPPPMGHELSVTDEWYVAINGVPVGPVRISELRRKAGAGAVNEDSLCWQEGLEEWRPIRSIPELATLVREAMQGGRPSLIGADAPRITPPAPAPPAPFAAPAPPAPFAAPSPPAPRTTTARPPAPSAPLAPRPSQVPAPPMRSNVVPLHARGSNPGAVALPASALIDDIAPGTSPLGGAAAARAPSPAFAPSPSNAFATAPAADPFAYNPIVPSPMAPPVAQQPAPTIDPFAIPTPAPAPIVAPLSTSPSIPPGYMQAPPERRGVPLWFWPILLLALGFGGTVAFMVFRPQQPQPLVINMPPAPTTPTATNTGDVPPPPPTADSAPAPTESAAPKKVATGPRGAAPPPAQTGKAADLSGLLGGGGGGGPVGGSAGGGAATTGGAFDQAAVERVVANHRAGVKRTCWERVSGPDQKSSVNVTVNATVAPNGSVSQTSSSGDDPVVAKCIESQVKSWQFPAPGESKQIQLPFKFVRQ